MKKYILLSAAFTILAFAFHGCSKKDEPKLSDVLTVRIDTTELTKPEIELNVSDTVAYKVAIALKSHGFKGTAIAFQLSITDGTITYNGRKANLHNFSKVFTDVTDTLRLTLKTGVVFNPSVSFNLRAQAGNDVFDLTQLIRFNLIQKPEVKDTALFSRARFSFKLDSINSIALPYLNVTLATDTALRGLQVLFSSSTGTFPVSNTAVIDNNGLARVRLNLDVTQPFLTQAVISAQLQTTIPYSVDTAIAIFSEARAIQAIQPVLEVQPATIVAADSSSISVIKIITTPPFLAGRTVNFKTSLGKFLFANAPLNDYSTTFDNNGVAKAYLYENDTAQTGKAIVLVKYYNNLTIDTSVDIIE
ncbi:MAG: hypothetical protein IPH78_04350 [Bacteroidetes bacterium]|nr:hypothetical protein [Bacteroidota bacterium]